MPADGPDEPRLLVAACTYNERENVPVLVSRILDTQPGADVVIVDDGSPDGTGDLADEMAAADPRVKVIHREGERGLGVATVDAFRYAIEHGYDLVINLDADLSHPPEAIPLFLERIDEFEVVVGSRYIPGGGIEGWGPTRHVMSRCINTYSRVLLGLTPRDVSGSFRCYRVDVLREIDFDDVFSKGYAFMEEVLFRCRLAGAEFAEVPFVFIDREAGDSKINASECVRAVVDLARLALLRRFRR
ncbi:MAG: polyprenol monophosphomannose synthase [Planctomycetota bacterium]